MGLWHVSTYQDYLEAKRLVDLRCLNRRVFAAFRSRMEALHDPVVADLGTGTGLMIRKLAGMHLNNDVRILGIDADESSCRVANSLIEDDLTRAGYRSVGEHGISHEPARAEAKLSRRTYILREGRSLSIEIRIGDVLAPGTPWLPEGTAFDAVTANAFLDLMPLKDTVSLVRRMLKPEGLFYTTINYDGITTLLPLYRDGGFETELLHLYNRSMESHRPNGRVSGGSRTGSRLFGVLLEQGYDVVEWGSSDWVVVPRSGRYRRGERDFLRAIVKMIYDEGRLSGGLKQEELDRWYSKRLEALEEHSLSFMNHQIDVLACRE